VEQELEECRQSVDLAWREVETLQREKKALENSLRESAQSLERTTRDLEVSKRESVQRRSGTSGSADARAAQELDLRVRALADEIQKKDDLLIRLKDALLKQRTRIEQQVRETSALEARLAALTGELEQARAQSRAAPPAAPAADEARKLQKKADNLAKELEAREARIAQLEQAASPEQPDRRTRKRIGALEAERDKAVRQQKEMEALLAERDKEVQDLRDALAARDAWAVERGPEERGERAKAGPAAATVPATGVPVDPRAPARAGGQADGAAYELIAAGNRALREGDLPGAGRAFREALTINPRLFGARLGMAAYHYTRGDFPAARDILGDLLDEDANHPQALGLAAIMSLQDGDAREATAMLEKAIRIDPNDAQLHNYLGITLHARKRAGEAIGEFRKAVELDPGHAEAMFNLAVLLATDEVPQIAEATSYYEKARKLGSERDEDLEKLLYP